MRKPWLGLGLASCLTVGLFLSNSSQLAAQPSGKPGVLAHRGVHQTFSEIGLTRDSCTATKIDRPRNPFLENTLASMRASWAQGATALELDVHPTTDGEFAVFHDYRLECRTNGTGVTRERPMSYLKELDIGYGYTANGGRTFPFRGTGIGLMPTLGEVLAAFPRHQFLINIKSNDPTEADRLIAYLRGHGIKPDGNVWIFADKRPWTRLTEIAPHVRLASKRSLKECSQMYLLEGWSGAIPTTCRGKFIAIPSNLAPLFWGWPNRLLQRMKDADVKVWLVGPVGRGGGIGLDDPADLSVLPKGFDGFVVTDTIEAIGPAVQRIRGQQ